MKLPITCKLTNTGAYAIYDADGNKIATVRTQEVHGAGKINKENAEFFVKACNQYQWLSDEVNGLNETIASMGNQ